jgi:hypothetical protein
MYAKKEKGRLITIFSLYLCFCILVSYLVPFSFNTFFYDLPPFFATLDLVFLLADASPFLLDFFLVAIIS